MESISEEFDELGNPIVNPKDLAMGRTESGMPHPKAPGQMIINPKAMAVKPMVHAMQIGSMSGSRKTPAIKQGRTRVALYHANERNKLVDESSLHRTQLSFTWATHIR
jgi:hypothetical protein